MWYKELAVKLIYERKILNSQHGTGLNCKIHQCLITLLDKLYLLNNNVQFWITNFNEALYSSQKKKKDTQSSVIYQISVWNDIHP